MVPIKLNTPLSSFGVYVIVVFINLVMSMYKPKHFFLFLLVFLNTDFRMKTKIEIYMYEYSNELMCIP